MKRVILKKTTYFNKKHKGLSKRITRYLENYVDEVGKAAQKRGESPWKNLAENKDKTEARWLLPVEKTGVFYTGGFLGEESSPGAMQANKQRGWIRRFTSRYVRALEKCPKRRSDGYRFVMSMSPEAVAGLTKSNISCDQAMREIWRTTMELYKERHGWNDPGEDIAWIAGAHHDTDNAHLHVLLFPTTKSGKLLRTNNARGPQRIDDLNELIAMANIATEIFWRELLPLNLQSQEFKEALRQNPDVEPALPTIESFKARSGIPGKKTEEEPVVSNPISLLDKRSKEDQDIEYGDIPILSKLKQKIGLVRGRIQLKATIAIALKWAKKKIKFFGVLKTLQERGKVDYVEQIEKVKVGLVKEFPEESKDIETLITSGGAIIKGKGRQELSNIISSTSEYTGAILARIAGDLPPEEINNETTLEWAGKLAQVFENATTEKDSQSKLLAIHNEGEGAKEQKVEEEKRTLVYRKLKRALERQAKLYPDNQDIINRGLLCLDKMIRGSKRICLVLEARTNEAKYSVSPPDPTSGRLSMRKEQREWALEKTPTGFEFIVNGNQGKPWPKHLDPDTVIEPLKDIIKREEIDIAQEILLKRAKIKSARELTDIDEPIYRASNTEEDESPLELILRLKGRKNLSRKKEALETMKRYKLRFQNRAKDESSDETGMLDTDLEGPEMEIR